MEQGEQQSDSTRRNRIELLGGAAWDAAICMFGLYTIIKFTTNIPLDGPTVILSGGAAGGLMAARLSYLHLRSHHNRPKE